MRTLVALTLILVVARVDHTRAQAPTGAMAGVVTDASGAALPGVRVGIANRDTGQTRDATTTTEGRYAAEALPPGSYQVEAELAGFKRVGRLVIVAAGTTTMVDVAMEIGDVTATVDVAAVAPLMHYDHHQVTGVVTRAQIENLPLNGRNFLELAKLEPGVTNPSRLADNRTFVSPLGAGLQTIPRVGYTRMTVDGASVTTPQTVGTLLDVSQDAVQEFQISTVNFDLATSLTSNGAINIVTRSGSNEYLGSVFSLYRDHRLAAYPALRRDPANPDPFFQRHQFGGWLGGPLRRNRAQFFATYERHDQRSVIAVQPRTPRFAALGGIFASPYAGNLFTARVDAQLSASHHAFARFTHDDNDTFTGGVNVLPSGWFRRANEADQSVIALTSVLSADIVNDARVSYLFVNQFQNPATAQDCAGCFGLGAPRITVAGVGFTFGTAATLAGAGGRYQFTDNLAWHRGDHRLRFGFDVEHSAGTGSLSPADAITLFAPGVVDPAGPVALFTTAEDVLQLPLQRWETTVGPGNRDERIVDAYRLYANDTWSAGSRVTVNAGLAWSYEPNALNYDLTKPALLVPILGSGGLGAPRVQRTNVSPAAGIVWSATRDGKTVVRAGAGRYFDPVGSTNSLNLLNERFVLSPVGTGRFTIPGSSVSRDGRALEFQRPTPPYTGAYLLGILADIREELSRSLNADNRDFTFRNLDRTKAGSNLYDPSYAAPYAVHASLGIQRELAPGLVASADFVWKRFVHTFINAIDYNRWNSRSGPVIPACETEAQKRDLAAVCSNGNIFFDTTIGRARYVGLLARVEKRFSGRAQLLASYALGSYVGANGTGNTAGTTEAAGMRGFGFNNDDWSENYGTLPTDQRHVLNVSGFANLPWGFQIATSIAAYSAPPLGVYVDGVDFNGDGTTSDLLPGTKVNQFGRGLSEADLVDLVDRYNQQTAGKPLCCGQNAAPPLTLPPSFSFGDSFFTQDIRLTRTFAIVHARLALSADVFNLFNTANLIQYGANLRDSSTFGQPSARISQVFGSGGPRAFQLGARLTF